MSKRGELTLSRPEHTYNTIVRLEKREKRKIKRNGERRDLLVVVVPPWVFSSFFFLFFVFRYVFLDSLQRLVVGVSHFDVGKAAADSIGHWFQSCLDEGHPDLYRINREQTNKALKIFLLCFLLLALNYPSDVEEDNVQDAKGRSGEPDGEEGDEREGDTPDEGQWQSEQGGQQAVNPVAGTGEKNVR